MKTVISRIGILLVVGICGYGFGYFMSPDKLKVVEKEKVIKEEIVKEVTKYDPTTGKITERTVEKGTKETAQTSKKSEAEKTRKNYAIKGGAAMALKDPNKIIPRVGFETRLPFMDLFIGIEGDINIENPLIGTYLRLGF